MKFQDALQIVKDVLAECGTIINEVDYDGLIVKKLAASNTLDEGRTSNQTHIAITGEQMDIFPYLCADGYHFNGSSIVNEDLKKYFIIRVKVILDKNNCNYLGNINAIQFRSDTVESSACVVRSKRVTQGDQLQLSMLNSDGDDFIAFRRLLHEGMYLVVLKYRGSMKYHLFGVRADEEAVRLNPLNNKFFRTGSQTIVDAEMFEVPHKDVTVEKNYCRGFNELYYGVPGAGKSYTIDKIVKDSHYERVVFHPDYTYSDFVGQIMPRLKKTEDGYEKLTYEYVPGPFTKALSAAENDPDHMFYLIIEEINRGNAPAIFGDIFQLLDRNEDGSGKYTITNFDVARTVYGEESVPVRIPANLSILATMNTSDQNVFTLDTAFQRRWNMKYIRNNINEAVHSSDKIQGSNISWGIFANTVNEEIIEYNTEIAGSEDKQLGAYFAKQEDLASEIFPEKVLKYLWDDAFRLDRDKIFNSEIKSIGEIVEKYHEEIIKGKDPIKRIMNADVYNRMIDVSANSVEEALDNTEVFSVIDKE